MAITIEVDGIEYENFVDVSVLRTLDTLSGEFTFNSRVTSTKDFPIKSGQETIIRVEGIPVVTGFVESNRVFNDEGTHDIVISGRDRTNDVIDSTFGENVSFQSDISLKDLIEQTLEKVGIPNIKVIDRVGDLTNFLSSEINKSAIGDTIFDFLRDTAMKKQVFLITDGLGNIIISRSNGSPINDLLVNDPNNPTSNIIRSEVDYNESERYNKYTVKSQENVAGLGSLGGLSTPENIVNKDASATDSAIRESRTLTIAVSKSYSTDQLVERAKWEANIRRVKSRAYSATMQGHLRPSKDGIWRPNQLVQIVDVPSDINAVLLANTVEYKLNNDDGNHTVLTFVDPDAYQVQAEEPIATKKSNKVGLNLTL